MEVHNTIEDTVIARVDEIFTTLEDPKENTAKYCTCNQCRMDIVCYVLNRTPPHYIVSSRGAARVHGEGHDRLQKQADITSLIHEGLKAVNHHQRPNFVHSHEADKETESTGKPVYNVPTIMGRIFDGNNFAPLANVKVELLRDGELVPMKDANWQNPYNIVSNTEGKYSFWPAAEAASKGNKHRIFEYALRVSTPEFETMIHYFKIPVASETQPASSFALTRTFKLPDLYMFPPGEAEKNGYLD